MPGKEYQLQKDKFKSNYQISTCHCVTKKYYLSELSNSQKKRHSMYESAT